MLRSMSCECGGLSWLDSAGHVGRLMSLAKFRKVQALNDGAEGQCLRCAESLDVFRIQTKVEQLGPSLQKIVI